MKQMYVLKFDAEDDPILVFNELDENGAVTRTCVVAAGLELDEDKLLHLIESEQEG